MSVVLENILGGSVVLQNLLLFEGKKVGWRGVLEYLQMAGRRGEVLTGGEIGNRIGISQSATYQHLDRLQRRGDVVKVDGGYKLASEAAPGEIGYSRRGRPRGSRA